MADKKKKRPEGPTSAGVQRGSRGQVIGKVGKTSAATNTINRKKKKDDAHAPWKAKYKKETGEDPSGIKGRAGYNVWLRKQRAARAKAKSGGIAGVAGKAKGSK